MLACALRREHIESFLIDLLARWTPATVNNRYWGLQAFFRWCLEEDVIRDSPMARMRPPRVPEQPVPVLRTDDVKRLIATAEKTKSFDDVRDAAILRIFYSTGIRLAELANLRYAPDDPEHNDVDLDQQVLRVMGKGRRERLVNMGTQSTRALDRYERLRRRHPDAHKEWLWLSRQGRFTESGIGQMVSRRGEIIGLKVHPHQLRHSWAHATMSKGMTTNDLKMAGGLRSNAMLEPRPSAPWPPRSGSIRATTCNRSPDRRPQQRYVAVLVAGLPGEVGGMVGGDAIGLRGALVALVPVRLADRWVHVLDLDIREVVQPAQRLAEILPHVVDVQVREPGSAYQPSARGMTDEMNTAVGRLAPCRPSSP